MDAQQTAAAITARAAGQPYRQIGQMIGVADTTVMRALDKPDRRAQVEALAQQMMDKALQDAVDIRTRLIQIGRQIVHADQPQVIPIPDQIDQTKLLEMATKEASGLRQTAGIDPSHTQSVIIHNLYNQDNSIHLEQASEVALKHLGILDVEQIASPDPDNGA